MKYRRFIRSILVLIIAAAAIVMCFAAGPSFADSSETVYYETEDEAAAELREHLKQREKSVTIGLKGRVDQEGLEELIGSLMQKAVSHTGEPDEGDYLAFQYSSYKGFGRTTYAGFTPAVEVEYTLSYYDDAAQEAEVDKKISEIIAGLELDEKTDFEKIAAIHDYICDNVGYEAGGSGDIVRTAYGALIEGRAVCQGYSVSLYRLLLEAGIDNRIIFGQGLSEDGLSGAHSWNIIELNDEYYYIDVTWDDVGHNYDYFMVPAENGFEKNHIADDSYDSKFFSEEYPMSVKAYTEEAVGLKGKLLKLAKALANEIRKSFLHE